MKIIQVIDSLDIGGAERMCVNISNLLTSKSVDNCIIVTRELGPLSKQIDSPKVKLLAKKNSLDVFAFYQFYKIIKKNTPDVLHAHSTSIYWAVLIKIIFPELKLIWHDHLGSRPNENNSIFNLIQKKIDIVLAINEWNFQWYLNEKKRNSLNVFYLANFPFLRNLKIPKNSSTVKIVHVANLHNPKDHITHVRAISELIKYPHVENKIKVRFFGNFSDSIYVQNLVKLIDELNLSHVIKLMGPCEDIANELSNADIGVLTSTSEGLPVSLLEYGLAGLAVIATNVGQCAEVLGHGQFGLVIEKEDYQQLSKKLLILIDDQLYRKQMGNEFKIHVENEFGGEKFYKNYSKIIN